MSDVEKVNKQNAEVWEFKRSYQGWEHNQDSPEVELTSYDSNFGKFFSHVK